MLSSLQSLFSITASVPETASAGQAGNAVFDGVFSALMDKKALLEAAPTDPATQFPETAANVDQVPEHPGDLSEDIMPDQASDDQNADSVLFQLVQGPPDQGLSRSGAPIWAIGVDRQPLPEQRIAQLQMMVAQADTPAPLSHTPPQIFPQQNVPTGVSSAPVAAGLIASVPVEAVPADLNQTDGQHDGSVAELLLRRPDHSESTVKPQVFATKPAIEVLQDKGRIQPSEGAQKINPPEPATENFLNRSGAESPQEGAVPRSVQPDMGVELRMEGGAGLVADPVPDGDILVVGASGERQGAAPTTASQPGIVAPDTSRIIAQQMVVAVTQTAGQPIEIALNPEELGRVRMQIVAGDGAVMLQILAERPETTDLLRRHIETLAQEFRSLGFSDISFSFGNGRPRDSGMEQISDAQLTVDDDMPVDDQTAASPRLAHGVLDLRL